MLTRDEFARQAAWPRERVHGWAPGSYSCTCGDCGVHYLGDKRSVQCYPCAAKFVPPPRPETPEEIRADRDRLDAELARVRRNHLRRMASNEAISDAYGRLIRKLQWKMAHARGPIIWGRLLRFQQSCLHEINAIDRAALAQPQDGTTEGQA